MKCNYPIFGFLDFELIYHENKKLVFNLALHYTQNIEDAEEITQDVFVKVHQNLEDFKGDSKLSTWIYKITINKSLDFLKSKKAKKRFSFMLSIFKTDSVEILYDGINFNHPGIELENKEQLENIFKIINLLPDNQKTAIILSKVEQKSNQEISQIMEVSLKAVESLIQRGKHNLLKKLIKHEGK